MLLTRAGYAGVLHIPVFEQGELPHPRLYTSQRPGMALSYDLENSVTERYRSLLLRWHTLPPDLAQQLKTRITIPSVSGQQGNEESDFVAFATAMGYINSVLIYMFIFYYGTQVMRSVLEEKNNRMVEVLISSLRPFRLLLGKIVGLGLLGLTQFAIWSLLMAGLGLAFYGYLGLEHFQGPLLDQTLAQSSASGMTHAQEINYVLEAISSMDMLYLLTAFLVFFMGAYLFYGALFAGVGAISGSDTDTQQFLLPVSLPLVLSVLPSMR
ncbi:MAG: ABC transporter permease [Cytophagales bacterium]|nr:ABC transporter permease [Cytophagales bacterium]